MDAVIFVEVLGRRGQVDQRVRVDRFPFVLGRAYTCDLILDDRHVDPQHARLELGEHGGVVLRDLASRNGLVDVSTGRRVEALAPAQGGEVRLGRTVVRLRAPDHPVPPALVAAGPHPLLRRATSPAAAVLWLPLVIGAATWGLLRNSYTEIETRTALEKLLTLAFALVAWSGLWALLGRLLLHSHRFAAHLAAACAYWLAWAGLSGLLDYARFAVSPIAPVQNARFVGESLLLAWLVFTHLSLATGLRRGARVLAGAGVLSAALTVAEINDHNDRRFWVRTLPYWSELEPVNADWLPAESPEEFFDRSRALEGELAGLAERERARSR